MPKSKRANPKSLKKAERSKECGVEEFESFLRRETNKLVESPAFQALNPQQKYERLAQSFERAIYDRNKFEYELQFWERAIDQFNDVANEGRINGLRLIALIATKCTSLLESWAKYYPRYLSEVAGEYREWPVIATTRRADIEEKLDLVEMIELGSRQPSSVTPTQGPPKRKATRIWAEALRWVICAERGETGILAIFDFAAVPELSKNDFWYEELSVDARHLRPYAEVGPKGWWLVAERIYEAATAGKVHEIYGFQELINMPEKNKLRPSRIKTDIKKLVKQAFHLLR